MYRRAFAPPSDSISRFASPPGRMSDSITDPGGNGTDTSFRPRPDSPTGIVPESHRIPGQSMVKQNMCLVLPFVLWPHGARKNKTRTDRRQPALSPLGPARNLSLAPTWVHMTPPRWVRVIDFWPAQVGSRLAVCGRCV